MRHPARRGRRAGPVRRAEAARRRNVVVAHSSFWGPVDGYLALLAQTRGDRDAAAAHAQEAVARARDMQAPLLAGELEARFDCLFGPPD